MLSDAGEPSAVLARLRRIVSAHLPAYDSLVGLEVCLAIGEHQLVNVPLTLTRLQQSVNRSPGAVRRIVQFLERDGWIRIDRQPDDGRGRLIRPSTRLTGIFEQLIA